MSPTRRRPGASCATIYGGRAQGDRSSCARRSGTSAWEKTYRRRWTKLESTLASAVRRAEADETLARFRVASLSENDTLVPGRTTLTVTDSFADGKARHYVAETNRLPRALQEVAAAAQAVVEASRTLRASTRWMNLNPFTP